MENDSKRIIARLDIKSQKLIKSVQLEGLRVVGSPTEYAVNYYDQGADELIYMDVVASLYGRNHLAAFISEVAKDVFIPITAGGGIRNVEDAATILKSGADKIAINTAAVARPSLISELAEDFGRQCVVVSIEAKSVGNNDWAVMTNNGRERSGKNLIDWVQEAIDLGAGEILLTSVDREGTRKGTDLELIRSVCRRSTVSVIVSGGVGNANDALEAINAGADAVALADLLHYRRSSIAALKKHLTHCSVSVR